MSKYGDIVAYCVSKGIEMDDLQDEWQAKLDALKADAKQSIHDAFTKYTEGMEQMVKDWSVEDFSKFCERCVHDDTLSENNIMTVATAFKKTHPDDVFKVPDSVVALAMGQGSCFIVKL